MFHPYGHGQGRLDSDTLYRFGLYHDTAERLIAHENMLFPLNAGMVNAAEALKLSSDLHNMRFTIDGVRENKHPILDADETIFSPRELVQIRRDPFYVEYPEFKAAFIVPIDSTGDTGADFLGFERRDWHQRANWIHDEAKDYPYVGVSKKQATLPVHTLGTAFKVNIQEIRKAAFARKSPLSADGPSLVEEKTQGCVKAIRMMEESIIAKGDSLLGIEGFYNNAAWPSYTIPGNGTGNSDRFTKKSAKQNLDDLTGMFSAIANKELYIPNTLLAEKAFATHIRTQIYDGTGGNFPGQTTVWEFFKNKVMADYGNIDLIGYNRVLDGASGATKSPIMMYKKDPKNVQQAIPQPIEIIGPFPISSTEIEVKLRGRHGGVHFRNPLCGVRAEVSRT